LDGIVNTEFTDVAQVANAARNMEILRERSSQNNKRNGNRDRIRPIAQDSNQRGYDQKGYDGHGYDRQGGNSDQKDCPKNGGNGGRGDENDNQPATKGRVFSSTKDQAANSSGTISELSF
ncbi:hypothetical protein Tco_1579055, partial [Tanacetum coccineum]